MAERSRAYVSDAFAHIPPWCNGSTRVFGTFGPGSNPGGQASTQAAKRRHALVAQWIERPSPERKATSPILVEGTHETPPTIMHGALLLFSLKPSRLVRLVHHEATPL